MTSNFDDDERALNRALHGHVDPLTDSPLGLDDVQGKARVVRRRRQLAAGAALAVAAAVIVPTAVIATRGLDDGQGPGPATESATSTPTGASESPGPEPSQPEPTKRAPIDIAALPVGDAPKIDWAEGADVHRADGSTVAGVLPEGTTGLAPLGDGWVVATRDGEGNGFARFVPADGMAAQVLFELDGHLTTSPLGEVVAFTQPDGQVKIMQDGGADNFSMAPMTATGPYDTVAVTSEDCREAEPEGGGCTVLVNAVGEEPGAWFTTSHGIVDRLGGPIVRLTAWSAERYAGITRFNDDLTTCSSVRDAESGDEVWKTCDNRVVDFSPTGAAALGIGSVGSGNGEGQITLLDAADGSIFVDLVADEQHQVFATQWAWEDDSHVLVVVREGLDWSVVRLGTDGSLELAVEPRGGDEIDAPFILQTVG